MDFSLFSFIVFVFGLEEFTLQPYNLYLLMYPMNKSLVDFKLGTLLILRLLLTQMGDG